MPRATARLLFIGACFAAITGPAAATGFSLPTSAREEIERVLASSQTYIQLSPRLGWTIRPSVRAGLFRSNSQGLRAPRRYTPEAGAGVLRVAAFGDSFVHCDEVAEEDSWSQLISSASSKLEILNFGVSAYGLDQALLRYREEGSAYHPHVVLIGFMDATFHRNLTTFRPFWNRNAGLPFGKPRFILRQGRLVLVPNPLPTPDHYRRLLQAPEPLIPQLGAYDRFYRRDHRSAASGRPSEDEVDGVAIALAILDSFIGEVRSRGAAPLVVLFPSIDTFRSGRAPAYGALLTHLRQRGHPHLDLVDAFFEADLPIEAVFTPGHHYSPAGNRVVADRVRRRLEDMAKP